VHLGLLIGCELGGAHQEKEIRTAGASTAMAQSVQSRQGPQTDAKYYNEGNDPKMLRL